MKNWKQFTFVAIIAIVGIIISFMACDNNGNETTHVHQFGTEWKKDATQHWHECSCGEKADIANHTWAWAITIPATPTADGLETETCITCGQTNGTRTIPKITPIAKTYPITLKDGNLIFTVEYIGLPSDEEPAYLTYIKERITLVVNSEQDSSVEAVTHLMSKGNNFKITIVYTGESFELITWDTATQSFKIHNDWISTASNTDLSAASIRSAFNAVK